MSHDKYFDKQQPNRPSTSSTSQNVFPETNAYVGSGGAQSRAPERD